jgi:hypothetical protein
MLHGRRQAIIGLSFDVPRFTVVDGKIQRTPARTSAA